MPRHYRVVARHRSPLNWLAAACALAGLVIGGHAVASAHRDRAHLASARDQRTTLTPVTRSTQERADRASRPADLARPVRLRRPDVVVLLPRAARLRDVARLNRQAGVRGVAVLSRGSIDVNGHRLTMLGAGPDLRAFTPALTAQSDPLWASVARGELTLSFTKSQHWRRKLGATLTVRGRNGFFPVRLGAFAALGLGTADGLVNTATARMLGFQAQRELVVSAPRVDVDRLRADVARIFGARALMHSLRPRPVNQDALLSPYARATIPPSYLALYRAAATTCTGLPWTVLAAIGAVETGHGANTHVSSKGAMGPMQFLPSTFAAYAVDGDHDGVADIRDPADAVYTAARYLCYAGAGLGGQSLYDAIWAYNHADWYVREVINLAVAYS